MDRRKQEFEEEISEKLTDGEMERLDPDQAARALLNPRYEIRIRTERDPIVEETEIIRRTVKEIDDRYDRFMAGCGRPEGDALLEAAMEEGTKANAEEPDGAQTDRVRQMDDND